MFDVTQTLVETTVRKTIKDIKDSPKRSVRNLVDMGLHFSNGRFQTQLLGAAQTMLQNEQSPYYDLIKDVVCHTDEENLIRFGMNVGYNSCTVGARRIREIEEEERFNISWSVALRIDKLTYYTNQKNYFSLIAQGEAIGIYTWIIFADGDITSILHLAETFKNSAFIFLCSPHDIMCANFKSEGLEKIKRCDNTMISVKYEKGVDEACGLLRDNKRLYSIFYPYNKINAQDAENGNISENIIEEIIARRPAFTILIPDSRCDEATRNAVYKSVVEARMKQKYRTILWDLLSDSRFVDGIISDEACSVGFDTDGRILIFEPETRRVNYNFFDSPLKDILMEVFPKAVLHK